MKNIRFFQSLFLLVTFCIALQFSASAQWSTSATAIYPTTLTKSVGIGTSTPTQKLDVIGTTRTTKLQVTNGAVNGYYLKSDASGNASWASTSWLTSGTNQYSALTGNVGIGTTTPTAAKLTVAGTVRPLLGLKSDNTSYGTLQFTNNNSGAWKIKGLVATTAADDRLSFETDDMPIMHITGDGKVGIGTPSPEAQLTIAGTARPLLNLVNHHPTDDWSTIKFSDNGPGEWNIKGRVSQTRADDRFNFETDAAGTIMTMTGDGKVGIGTDNPESTLTVASSSNPVLELDGTSGSSNLKFTNGNSGYWFISTSSGDTDTDDRMYILNSDAGTAMVITGEGNVGIGTSSPDNKLDVCGTIRAKEIRVETGWSDFVFEDNFRLRPLAEVEQYIKENKHLPDVTPASEIQAEGLQVAKVMTEMMQKIEELTLYVIELKKDNDALHTQLNSLESSRK